LPSLKIFSITFLSALFFLGSIELITNP
jgi:hypothetical protein